VQVDLLRNGVKDDTTVAVRQIIDNLVNYKKKFDELWNDIKNFMPQVGWKFDFNVSWLSGDLGCTWGYREDPNHIARVYRGWTATASLQVISATGSLSFGVQLSSHIVAKLTGSITGAVSLFGSVESPAPGAQSSQKKIGTKGSVTAALDGEATVDVWWIKAQRKAGISWTLEVTAELDFGTGQGVGVSLTAVSKPLTFAYQKHSIWGDSYYEEDELTGEATLISESFPSVSESCKV
jgi:hypothetical protein